MGILGKAATLWLDIFVGCLIVLRLRWLVRSIGWRGILREVSRR